MIEVIAVIFIIVIWISLFYIGIKIYGPKKCPKCGHIALGIPSFGNTSSMDRVFICIKCKHKWYIDYTYTWWK